MGLSIRGYIIQLDTPIWTSPFRTRSAVGRLTRFRSCRRGSSLPRLRLKPHLHLELHLRRKLRLHLQLDLKLHLHPQLDLRLHPQLQLRPELEAETNRAARPTRLRQGYGVASRDAATVVSGRANPDKSATMSPWFRGARTVRLSQKTSGR